MSYILIFLFFCLFLLIIIESIYFLRKNTSPGFENQNTTRNWISPILFFVIILVAITGFIFFFLKNKSTPIPEPTRILFSSPTISVTLTPLLSLAITKKPNPAVTISSSLSPTLSFIGNPEATSSKNIVIVPKLPIAGNILETLFYLLTATGLLFLGILL